MGCGSSSSKSDVHATLNAATIATFNTPSKCYVVIHGKAYDVTRFLDDHPGGRDILLRHAGTDCSKEFEEAGHTLYARDFMVDFLVGDVVGYARQDHSSPTRFLYELVKATESTHNTTFYTFKHVPDDHSKHPLLLPIGKHVSIWYEFAGSGFDLTNLRSKLSSTGDIEFKRSYTPITNLDGNLEFLIKRYPEGVVSQFVHNLKPGERIAVVGPVGNLDFTSSPPERIGMIAAGSGITPMWQIIQHMLDNGFYSDKRHYRHKTESKDLAGAGAASPSGTNAQNSPVSAGVSATAAASSDEKQQLLTPPHSEQWKPPQPPERKPRIALLFSNRAEQDILLRSELDDYARDHKAHFSVTHTLSQAGEASVSQTSAGCAVLRGRVSQAMIREVFSALWAQGPSMMLVCGPKAFTDAMVAHLRALDVQSNDIHVF